MTDELLQGCHSLDQAIQAVRYNHPEFAHDCSVLLYAFERHQAVAAQQVHDARCNQ